MEDKIIKENNAVARREARRRRILENSENRLRKITGQTEVDSLNSSEVQTNDNTYNEHIWHTSHNTDDRIPDKLLNGNSGDIETNKFRTERKHRIETINEAQFETIYAVVHRKRLDYMILAVIVFILYSKKMGFVFGENVLVPFILLKLLNALICKEALNQPSIVQGILLLIGVPSIAITTFLKTYKVIKNCVLDLSVFLFSFIFLQKVWDIFNIY